MIKKGATESERSIKKIARKISETIAITKCCCAKKQYMQPRINISQAQWRYSMNQSCWLGLIIKLHCKLLGFISMQIVNRLVGCWLLDTLQPPSPHSRILICTSNRFASCILFLPFECILTQGETHFCYLLVSYLNEH